MNKMTALRAKLMDLRCLGIVDLRKYGKEEMGMENITPQIPKEILFKMVAYRVQDAMGLGSERADKAERRLLKEMEVWTKNETLKL